MAIAQEVVALAESELVRRLAAGESNHVSEEEYLLPRWRGALAAGRPGDVLAPAVGYLTEQRVSLKPSAPELIHETAPNADQALLLVKEIEGNEVAFGPHRRARAALRKLPAVGERPGFCPGVFEPSRSCYSAYWWLQLDERTYVAFKVSAGATFCSYVLLDMGEFETYRRQHPRVSCAH